MIDIRAARQEPDAFRAALARKGPVDAFDELLDVDARWRELETRVTDLRSQTKLKGKPSPEQLEAIAGVKEGWRRVGGEHAEAEQRRRELLTTIPTPPATDVPDGFTEDDAEVIREEGERPAFAFEARDHLDLALPHGWI